VPAQAVSSAPEPAQALREFLTERVWAYRRQGDTALAARTAALVSSQLLGTAWARYVIRMEPFASASRSQAAAWVGPTIQAYITGRRGADRIPRTPGPANAGVRGCLSSRARPSINEDGKIQAEQVIFYAVPD
jgi:hypothetical protein